MAYVIVNDPIFTTATVRCGNCNTAPANYATVSGGRGNVVRNTYTTVSGGYKNIITSGATSYSIIGGGNANTTDG